MLLYTCAAGKIGANTPIVKHPCGQAAKALSDAGHRYDLEKVKGFQNIPFATRKGDRAKIVELTGQPYVPVLVLDDGTTVAGTREIVDWAKANPAG